MIEPSAVVAALEAAGFTHLVWIPDSSLGTWDRSLIQSRFAPVRVTREGEAIGLAAGLMLGGAQPLVAMQCTGFFEAGDALRNVVHDLKLPLKLIIGVRSWHARQAGKSSDNCPHFADKLVQAWEVPYTRFDPVQATAAELTAAFTELANQPGCRAILWAE
jgi:sulfopyruvate decarboxylase TPP-binding subunit